MVLYSCHLFCCTCILSKKCRFLKYFIQYTISWIINDQRERNRFEGCVLYQKGKSISTSLFSFCSKYDEWPSLGVRYCNNEMNGLIEMNQIVFWLLTIAVGWKVEMPKGDFWLDLTFRYINRRWRDKSIVVIRNFCSYA